ncbi:ribonuclease H-like protein [Pilatotrama ljubarskyi]|nr:ribonuclease H-like protein [Pilatotrama ljubarskyi]
MSTTKPAFYAVAKGRKPGIYTVWADCKEQVINYNGAKYKKFPSPSEAETWIKQNVGPNIAREAMNEFLSQNPAFRKALSPAPPPTGPKEPTANTSEDPPLTVPSAPVAPATVTLPSVVGSMHEPADGEPWIVYSDGACRGNGRAGAVAGIGVWWGKDDMRNISERCPGDQTNNRAELIAIIRVLETAPSDKRPLVIKTDSQYSISSLTNWLPNWKRSGWRSASGRPVLNVLLIKYADALLEERRELVKQSVEFVKVLGHSGEEGNDGADRLANLGATMPPVPDRDWEDLIRQARARMSMASPTREVPPPVQQREALSDTRVAVPRRQAPVRTNESSAVRPSPEQRQVVAWPQVPAPAAPGSDVVRPPIRQSNEVVPSPSVSDDGDSEREAVPPNALAPEEVVHGDPNIEISPEEWEMYAECALSDDEFFREAGNLQ